MNQYTLVNHMFGLEIQVTADTRREARQAAVLKAQKFLRRVVEDNTPFYWTVKQSYHKGDYHVLVA